MAGTVVTLVVASYNHASYFREVLASVRDQDYSGEIDLIVTDDASQDDSQAVAMRLLDELHLEARTIFHRVNVGVCKTFNEALALARGEYVCFLAADDWMRADRVRRQVEALEAKPSATFCYSNMVMVDEHGKAVGMDYSEIFPEEYEFDQTHDALARLLEHNWIPAPSVMMRTQHARAIGGYDESLPFEDYDMWLRLAARGPIVYVPEALVYYRNTPNSLGKELDLVRLREKHEGMMRILRRCRVEQGLTVSLDLEYENARLAYLEGAPASTVFPTFKDHALHHRSLPAPWLYAALSGLRLPGAMLERLRSYVH